MNSRFLNVAQVNDKVMFPGYTPQGTCVVPAIRAYTRSSFGSRNPI